MSPKVMTTASTVQADVGPGDMTGVYYIPLCNLPFGTSWQQLKDFARGVCTVDRVEVFETSTSGWVRVKGEQNFEKAWNLLNGGIFGGRCIIASDRNKAHPIKIKEPTEAEKRLRSGRRGRNRQGKGAVSSTTASPHVPSTPDSSFLSPASAFPPSQYILAESIQNADYGHYFVSADAASALPRLDPPPSVSGTATPLSTFTDPSYVCENRDALYPYGHRGTFTFPSPPPDCTVLPEAPPTIPYPVAPMFSQFEEPTAVPHNGAFPPFGAMKGPCKIIVTRVYSRATVEEATAWIYERAHVVMPQIMDIVVPRGGRKGRIRGHVFIILQDDKAAMKAIEMLDRTMFKGITVLARFTEEKPSLLHWRPSFLLESEQLDDHRTYKPAVGAAWMGNGPDEFSVASPPRAATLENTETIGVTRSKNNIPVVANGSTWRTTSSRQ
ncbi:hypothetical protein S40293_09711 [Stachybotrys chartarum IBT 40293]|nr:hypothetical protein S40293_09711 [Stachybotrys chartarum IBT 40293]KFA74967.1 hypothetical protein S40288_02211 [Stachybotrys chartarum IBT 40288]